MDKMVELLKKQEAELVKKQRAKPIPPTIKFHPKIDIEESLRNGYVTMDEFEKTHPGLT